MIRITRQKIRKDMENLYNTKTVYLQDLIDVYRSLHPMAHGTLPRTDNMTCHKTILTRCWWLSPVILATQETDIRRLAVQSQPGKIVHETLSQKWLVEWLKGKTLSPSPSTAKKKKKSSTDGKPKSYTYKAYSLTKRNYIRNK
jgi:hypothetical protein